jgi:hypothetical protein
MNLYVYAVVIGLVLPWIFTTYPLLRAFRESVGKGVLKWLLFSAITVPAMLLLISVLPATK